MIENRINLFFTVTDEFEAIKTGPVGLSTLAKLSLKVNDNLPNVLYYGAVPINLDLNTNVKKEIFSDSEILKIGSELL